jgi:hypothetical protein
VRLIVTPDIIKISGSTALQEKKRSTRPCPSFTSYKLKKYTVFLPKKEHYVRHSMNTPRIYHFDQHSRVSSLSLAVIISRCCPSINSKRWDKRRPPVPGAPSTFTALLAKRRQRAHWKHGTIKWRLCFWPLTPLQKRRKTKPRNLVLSPLFLFSRENASAAASLTRHRRV